MTSRFSLAALLFALTASSAQAQHFGNPIVGGSDHRHVTYDPFSDTTYVDNTRHRIRESAYDYDRNCADPGSRQYVDRYYQDQHGRTVHEYGWTWTTHGKPHGDLTREVVTYTPNDPRRGGCQNGGGTHHRDRDIISYGAQQQGGTVRRDRDIVSYSPQQPPQGGTVERNRDIVSFGAQTQKQQPQRNTSSQMFGQFFGSK